MKVFISHAYSDKSLARKAAKALQEAGLEVWWDEQVLPGDNWADAHAKALDSSQAMVLLLSPSSLQSQEVRSDLSFALGRSIYKNRVVPILTSSYDSMDYSSVPWVLKGMNAVELDSYRRPEEAFRQVATRLKTSLQAAGN